MMMKKLFFSFLICIILVYANPPTQEQLGNLNLPSDLSQYEWDLYNENPRDFFMIRPTLVDAFTLLEPNKQAEVLSSPLGFDSRSNYQQLLNTYITQNYPGTTIDVSSATGQFSLSQTGGSLSISYNLGGQQISYNVKPEDSIQATDNGLVVNGITIGRAGQLTQGNDGAYTLTTPEGNIDIKGFSAANPVSITPTSISGTGTGLVKFPDGTKFRFGTARRDSSGNIQRTAGAASFTRDGNKWIGSGSGRMQASDGTVWVLGNTASKFTLDENGKFSSASLTPGSKLKTGPDLKSVTILPGDRTLNVGYTDSRAHSIGNYVSSSSNTDGLLIRDVDGQIRYEVANANQGSSFRLNIGSDFRGTFTGGINTGIQLGGYVAWSTKGRANPGFNLPEGMSITGSQIVNGNQIRDWTYNGNELTYDQPYARPDSSVNSQPAPGYIERARNLLGRAYQHARNMVSSGEHVVESVEATEEVESPTPGTGFFLKIRKFMEKLAQIGD